MVQKRFYRPGTQARGGGCFTAHNATSGFGPGITDFLEYVQNLPNFRTEINTASPAGISISYKCSD